MGSPYFLPQRNAIIDKKIRYCIYIYELLFDNYFLSVAINDKIIKAITTPE
jgi:hypothetical protein